MLSFKQLTLKNMQHNRYRSFLGTDQVHDVSFIDENKLAIKSIFLFLLSFRSCVNNITSIHKIFMNIIKIYVLPFFLLNSFLFSLCLSFLCASFLHINVICVTFFCLRYVSSWLNKFYEI
jgi:hypothetical protein